MARVKFDGVVEAVRYAPGGEVEWVRAYKRRGSSFSDHVLIDREAFIKQLKSGKNYLVGQRVPLMASTFETSEPIRVVQVDGKDVLVVGDARAQHDHLKGVPVI